MMDGYQFTLSFEVRDYECDLQGIVNNAIYHQYLEHARHRFLKSRGLDFAELNTRGVRLVVVRVEIDYNVSLRSGDEFIVALNTQRISEVRFGFLQDIYRLPERMLVLKAKVVCAATDEQGKPIRPVAVETLFDGQGR